MRPGSPSPAAQLPPPLPAPPPLSPLREFRFSAAKGAERRAIDASPHPGGRHFEGRRNARSGGRGAARCGRAFAALASRVGPGRTTPPRPLRPPPLRNEAAALARDGPLPPRASDGPRRGTPPARPRPSVTPRAPARAPPPARPCSSRRAPPPPARSRPCPPGLAPGADSLVCFCRNLRRGPSRHHAWEAEGENRGRAPFASDGPS